MSTYRTNYFQGNLPNGKIYRQWQADNGMYIGEILALTGTGTKCFEVESATVETSAYNCNKWLQEQTADLPDMWVNQINGYSPTV